jgi:SAM-dependent methyltransferase
MKLDDIKIFLCPQCRGPLQCDVQQVSWNESKEEIIEGKLDCSKCSKTYPIVGSIPRFVEMDNYAASFGYQWNKFAKTQVGGAQKIISKERFDCTAEWPQQLLNQVILEAGCGAGRFSEIALDTGAQVYSFDLSAAINASVGNITSLDQKRRHHPFQASIYDIPLPHGMFDKVYCLGVLQHCPDVKRAFMSLVPFLKSGGEIVIDCYLSQPLKHAFNLKYWLRPFFKWWKPTWLFSFWFFVISIAYDLKRVITAIPLVGKFFAKIVPIGRLNYEPEHYFTVQELKEIKTLSVFDMLSPKYDQCQKLEDVGGWMRESGLEIVKLTTGYNGINAKGKKV